MKEEILFSERQRFNQWWIWLILLAVNGLIFFNVWDQVIGGQQFGEKPMSNTGLLITAAISLLPTILFLSFRLDTKISYEGIYVRFFPFHIKFKHYTWDQLTKIFIRQYSPIAEYGGWGLRFGIGGNGKAYNVSGNKGLQLEFKNKKKLLIGTNKSEAINDVLQKIGQIKI